MNKLKKVNISARAIKYHLLDDGKVQYLKASGCGAVGHLISDDDLIHNNDIITFSVTLGETLKIEDKKYFTEKRIASCYMEFDDSAKQILDESLIHDGKLCIDLKNDSVVSSDYQIIPEEKFKDFKKNMLDEYFES